MEREKNKELNIVNFLRNGGTPKELEDKYAIKAKRHSVNSNLVLFKYNQLESPMGEEIVQEARGIILDELNNWEVVCYSFKKFFNHGEGHAAELDWESSITFEKLDGSLIQLYPYGGKWNLATSGTPDAHAMVGDTRKTFKYLTAEVFRDNKYLLPTTEYSRYCFAFELMTKYNRVVVQHNESRLVLTGARNLDTLEEVSYDDLMTIAMIHGWEIVQPYEFGTFEDVIKASCNLDPIKSEGYVVCDKFFNRQKLKCPAYVALHREIDKFGIKALLEIVRMNEESEVLTYFPEYKEEFNELENVYKGLVSNTGHIYDEIRNIEDQKEFAMKAKVYPYSGVLFALRSGKVPSVEEAYRTMKLENLMKLMGLK